VKRKVLGIALALSVAFIVLATGVAPAFANSFLPGKDHTTASGTAVINIKVSGLTVPILINVYHFDKPTSHGVRDTIDINLKPIIGPYVGIWLPVATMIDNPAVVAWQAFFDTGGAAADNQLLVKPWELAVCRISKTVFAYWTKPVTASLTGLVPGGGGLHWYDVYGVESVTLPPGCVVFQGYGSAKPYNGEIKWIMDLTWTGTSYDAKATLLCPAWHYCGPIGDPSYPTSITTDVFYDQEPLPP
jgi:hypothetical protein